MDGEETGQTEGNMLHLNRLQEEHRRYSQKLEFLLSKPYLSEEEKLEEVRLKKLKLRIKDQISALLSAPSDAFDVA